jgi:hypothetical protein
MKQQKRKRKAQQLTPAQQKTQAKLKASEATLADAPLVSRERQFDPVARHGSGGWCPTPRLRVGDVIYVGSEGGDHVVKMVNDCRAYCIPIGTRRVNFRRVADDKLIDFTAERKGISISPNAECDIKQRLGADWKRKLFGEQITSPEDKERNAESMETAETANKPPTAQPESAKSASGKQSKKGKQQSDAKQQKDKSKSAAKTKSASAETVSYKGRSERIKSLVKSGKFKDYAKDFDALFEVVNKEYPQSSPSKVRKVFRAALDAQKEAAK